MATLGELRLPAKTESIRTISSFLHAIGHQLELTDKCLFDVDLALDEAAANVVKHAYAGQATGDILIAAALEEETLRITVMDWGVPLDPRNVRPFDIAAPIESRISGGMGLHFIHQMMDSVQRETGQVPGEPNRLILEKKVERLHPGAQRMSSTRELRALMNVSEAVGQTADLDRLMQSIVNHLVAAIDAERATLYLLDEANGQLVSKVLQQDQAALKEIRLEIGQGIAGQVAQTGETINLEDVSQDERFAASLDVSSDYRCHSMLVVPMKNAQQQIIGVVQVINKRGGAFTRRDERLLKAITAQAAISVENARLYEQEMAQQLLNQELETARAIQASFLPDAVPDHPTWDVALHWRPMHEVAGDFYDFYRAPDGRLALVIADVSGKGIPAALFMAMSVTVLRFAMSLGLTPGEMLTRANEAMLDEQNSRMFTTAFVGYLDQISGDLAFASAGHNPPICYRAKDATLEYLDAVGVAMGVFPTADYADGVTHLAVGDVLVLYTDGITECINAQEEEFGEERLEALIQMLAGDGTAQRIVTGVVRAITAFSGESGAFDDETLIVIKRRA